jgi:hypothetical protein
MTPKKGTDSSVPVRTSRISHELVAVDRAVCPLFRQHRRRSYRPNERGFALLLVLLMAAAVAFSLYTQIPRVGFETMREREQLLMDRGNQYKRAIQVFYAVNHRYPAKLEELENTNEKRFLRRRYKDPMTGKDEWRLIHTNGSFLTDSLVKKPPTQNAANGTPGAGILPGGGPLGTNNMNAQPGQPNPPIQGSALGLFGGGAPGNNNAGNNAGNAPTNPDGTPQTVALNPAAQRRPSDRLIPGDGLMTPTGVNPAQDNGVVYPPGYNPATFNPNDPSTWPPISLASANPGQPGQPQPGQPGAIPGIGGNPQQPATQITPQPFQPFGAQPQQQPVPGQPFVGGTVQPTPFPFGPQPNPGGDATGGFQPFQGQTNPPQQTPSAIPGQAPGQGGMNPQPAQVFNPGAGFNGNPFDPSQQPAPAPSATPFGIPGFGNQQQPANPQAGNQIAGAQNPAGLNPALQAINNQLSAPGGTPASVIGTQTAPGIAGVASTFEGVGIKIYHERSKYKEWEFVFDPSTTAPAGLPGAGQNPGQQGQPGQQPGTGSNGLFGPNPFAPNSGQSPSGQSPNPFAPSSGQPQTPAMPSSNPFAPSTNPFAPSSSPFGTPNR